MSLLQIINPEAYLKLCIFFSKTQKLIVWVPLVLCQNRLTASLAYSKLPGKKITFLRRMIIDNCTILGYKMRATRREQGERSPDIPDLHYFRVSSNPKRVNGSQQYTRRTTLQNLSFNKIPPLAHFNQAVTRNGEEAEMHMWLLWS